MAMVAGSWIPLGNQINYRKFDLYTMEWFTEVDMDKYCVACASYGGPIALIRDSSKLVPVSGAAVGKPTIYIFTAAGTKIAELRWSSGRLLKLGWSSNEELLCIQDDGQVLIHDMFGTFKRNISLGKEASDIGIVDCQVFSSFQGTGVAVLTSSYRIYCINNIEEPRTRRMAEIPGEGDISGSCWSVVNQDRQTRCLVCKNTSVYILDSSGQCQQQTPRMSEVYTSFTCMSVSVNCNYLALFTDTGILWLGSADLQTCYCEFDTHHQEKPGQMVWCGGGAVVCCWAAAPPVDSEVPGGGGGGGSTLLLVGTNREWSDEVLDDGPVHLHAECDGVRVLARATHTLLTRVPDNTAAVLAICSMSGGALLLAASQAYSETRSHRAAEYLASIRAGGAGGGEQQLQRATAQCVEAAAMEYEPAVQKLLLKAASLGKSFLGSGLAEQFVSTCRTLRVLNAVRDYGIGLPITFTQLEELGVRKLIDRLVLRRQYCLAMRICQYLRVAESEGVSMVLAHWACYKVSQTELSDEVIAADISRTLKDTPGISFSQIANKALGEGRTQLAIKLLDFEPRASEQVPLLKKMGKIGLALTKAVDSGDSNLVYDVILHHKDQQKIGDFLFDIRHSPTAFALYLQLCRQQNVDQLRDIYHQEDNHQEEGNCHIRSSYQQTAVQDRVTQLQLAHDCFVRAKNEFLAKTCSEEQKLLRNQSRLEEKYQTPYLDTSLHQTMYNLMLDKNYKLADELRKDFRVPDNRYWWCRISAMAEAGDWLELEKFSKSKKSPIGYEPFVDVCVKHGNKFEAQKYLPRLLPENRIKYYVKAGQLRQAAEIAFQQKSEPDLTYVAKQCGPLDRAVLEQITTMKAQLHIQATGTHK